MDKKTFVLDTNVLLHDPEAIQKFEANEVVMPLIVLEEIDKMKRLTSELGKNARAVIRFINSLKGNVCKGILLENGSNFSIFFEKKAKNKEDFPIPLDNVRHRVLYAAYSLKKEGKDVVIMISKDFILRIKAESIGICAQDYIYKTESFDSLYKGYREIEMSNGEHNEFITKGFLNVSKKDFNPNEYCKILSESNSNAIGKFNPDQNRVEFLEHSEREVWGINRLNFEQKCAMDLLMRDDIRLVCMLGQAGTGKTLMALTCGLKKVFDEETYNRILISRPIMPLGKDIGYLPGTKEEKMYHWMQPIYDNLEYICEMTSGSGNGLETKKWIIESEKIEMEAVTFIRGRSLANTYMIIDEAQNLTPHEVKTIIYRAGKGTKVILTGDPTQIDNPYLDKDSNALTYVVSRFKSHGIFGHVLFNKTERSDLAAMAASLL